MHGNWFELECVCTRSGCVCMYACVCATDVKRYTLATHPTIFNHPLRCTPVLEGTIGCYTSSYSARLALLRTAQVHTINSTQTLTILIIIHKKRTTLWLICVLALLSSSSPLSSPLIQFAQTQIGSHTVNYNDLEYDGQSKSYTGFR